MKDESVFVVNVSLGDFSFNIFLFKNLIFFLSLYEKYFVKTALEF